MTNAPGVEGACTVDIPGLALYGARSIGNWSQISYDSDCLKQWVLFRGEMTNRIHGREKWACPARRMRGQFTATPCPPLCNLSAFPVGSQRPSHAEKRTASHLNGKLVRKCSRRISPLNLHTKAIENGSPLYATGFDECSSPPFACWPPKQHDLHSTTSYYSARACLSYRISIWQYWSGCTCRWHSFLMSDFGALLARDFSPSQARYCRQPPDWLEPRSAGDDP